MDAEQKLSAEEEDAEMRRACWGLWRCTHVGALFSDKNADEPGCPGLRGRLPPVPQRDRKHRRHSQSQSTGVPDEKSQMTTPSVVTVGISMRENRVEGERNLGSSPDR